MLYYLTLFNLYFRRIESIVFLSTGATNPSKTFCSRRYCKSFLSRIASKESFGISTMVHKIKLLINYANIFRKNKRYIYIKIPASSFILEFDKTYWYIVWYSLPKKRNFINLNISIKFELSSIIHLLPWPFPWTWGKIKNWLWNVKLINIQI